MVRVSRSLRVAKAMHAGLKREVQIFQDAWPYTIQEFYQQVYTACARLLAQLLCGLCMVYGCQRYTTVLTCGGSEGGGSEGGRE